MLLKLETLFMKQFVSIIILLLGLIVFPVVSTSAYQYPTWPGLKNIQSYRNGTKDQLDGLTERQNRRRPPALVAWIAAGADLTYTVVYSVSRQCSASIAGLTDAYIRSNEPAQGILNWQQNALENAEGFDEYGTLWCWPDVVGDNVVHPRAFYTIINDVILVVAKVKIPGGADFFDSEEIGSFAWSAANSIGLGDHVYPWIDLRNGHEAPSNGWNERMLKKSSSTRNTHKGLNKNTPHGFVYEGKFYKYFKMIYSVDTSISDQELDHIFHETDYNVIKRDRVGDFYEQCVWLDGNQCSMDESPYIHTDNDTSCQSYRYGFDPDPSADV